MVFEDVQKVVCQTSRISSSRVTISPGAADQGVQQVELLVGQHDLDAVAPDPAGRRVEVDVLQLEHTSEKRYRTHPFAPGNRPTRGSAERSNLAESRPSRAAEASALSAGGRRPAPRCRSRAPAGPAAAGSRTGPAGSRSAVARSMITRLRRATAVSRAAMFTGGPKTSPSRITTEPVASPTRTSGIRRVAADHVDDALGDVEGPDRVLGHEQHRVAERLDHPAALARRPRRRSATRRSRPGRRSGRRRARWTAR